MSSLDSSKRLALFASAASAVAAFAVLISARRRGWSLPALLCPHLLPKAKTPPGKPQGDEFSTVSKEYAVFRPNYPSELFQQISRYYDAHCNAPRTLAVDLGTGTGLVAVPVARDLGFRSVIGIDKSANQIAHALKHPGVEYRVGSAVNIDLSDGHASLITAGEAAHWFDLPAFFKEAQRVLVPRGVLAIFGYPVGRILEPADAQPHYEAYYKFLTSSPYWASDNKYDLLDNAFATVNFAGFTDIERHYYPTKSTMTVQRLLGNVRTWSALALLRQARTDIDPSVDLEKALLELPAIKSSGGLNATIVFELPFFLVLATRG